MVDKTSVNKKKIKMNLNKTQIDNDWIAWIKKSFSFNISYLKFLWGKNITECKERQKVVDTQTHGIL